MERAENPRSKGSNEGTWKRDNCQKNWSLGHTRRYTKHRHKDTGGSNICIIDETIMVAQYAKRRHIKSKESWPQMNKVGPCSTTDHSHKIQGGSMSQQNVIWSVTRSCATWAIGKDDDATISPRYSIQTTQNIRILTMRIKELKSNMEETIWLPINNENH